MMQKKTVVVPLATALASLASTAKADVSPTQSPDQCSIPIDSQKVNESNIQPNTTFQVGEDLLGLLVTKNADGTVVAQHASHASHASHHSHYSGR
jgi:hypothetical protein